MRILGSAGQSVSAWEGRKAGRRAYGSDLRALDGGARCGIFMPSGEAEFLVEAREQAREVRGGDAGGGRLRLVRGKDGRGGKSADIHGGGGGCWVR